MKITVHTLVKNEERYLWFAVTSVIDYVDEVMVWDTGSTDNTIQIIKDLEKAYPEKIKSKFINNIDISSFTDLRQKMLEETKSEWILVVDGDEVWWDEKIKQTTMIMRQENNLQTVVNQYINLVGDIYHYQNPKASFYKIDDKVGSYTIRAMSKKNISGLKTDLPHGKQGYFDKDNNLIQDLDQKHREWIEGASYMHFTHLTRSSSSEEDRKVVKRSNKMKHEIGFQFPLDFYYPEVFFKNRPNRITSPWKKFDKKFLFKSALTIPLRKIKRNVTLHKSGY